ncbi:hypothetical protein GCM10009559_81950 [Pseudonocardia zijingensis]|uniref:Excreted virulence factor EspC (Type VII ESX diderm) n=1 Tax=Pseudonocardia zijingensis TaxID=153376 RepID=A0ABP3YYQ6_9PSEU
MEARAHGHALSVIAYARSRLGDAGTAADSVRKKLNEGLGLYWNTIGETMARDKALGPHYKDLLNALKELDAAIGKARSASDRLLSAALEQSGRK